MSVFVSEQECSKVLSAGGMEKKQFFPQADPQKKHYASTYHLTVPFFISPDMNSVVGANDGRAAPGTKATTVLRSIRRLRITLIMVLFGFFLL